MSLMRWLSAGKSLDGVRENVGRYQVTHERLLPDFRVERQRQVPTAGERLQRSAEETRVQRTGMDNEMKTQPAGQGTGVWQRMNAFFKGLWPRRTVTADKSGQSVVQGELSLDSVKVMRNDLSDSDLELVARRPVLERPLVARSPVNNLKQAAAELTGTGKS